MNYCNKDHMLVNVKRWAGWSGWATSQNRSGLKRSLVQVKTAQVGLTRKHFFLFLINHDYKNNSITIIFLIIRAKRFKRFYTLQINFGRLSAHLNMSPDPFEIKQNPNQLSYKYMGRNFTKENIHENWYTNLVNYGPNSFSNSS